MKLNSNWLKIIVNKEEDESTNGGERSSTKGRGERNLKLIERRKCNTM